MAAALKVMWSPVVGLLGVLLLAAPNGVAEVRHDATTVALVQLIATPERYDGVLIRTIGFLWLEFEGNALYLHREDYENAILKQSVWLDFASRPTAEQLALRGNYVIVEGVFTAKRNGHLGMSTGTIEKINRLQLWSGPQNRERGRAPQGRAPQD